MELLLKGIHLAFNMRSQKTHDLHKLCEVVGISMSESDDIILQALSDYIYWASRYPTPNNADRLFRATELFDKQRRKSGKLAHRDIAERALSQENCERLWNVIAEHYHKAREARLESVELRR